MKEIIYSAHLLLRLKIREMVENMKKQNPKIINYDPRSDVLYIGLKKGAEEEFIEISPGVNIELDQEGKVIGIEILNASKLLKSVVKPLQKQVLEPAVQ